MVDEVGGEGGRGEGTSPAVARPPAARFVPRRAWVPAFGVLLVHLLLVISIAHQPLAQNKIPGAYRSPIWRLHNDTIHRTGPGADFFAVYHAGVALRTGLDPYRGREDPQETPYAFPFRYLPVVGQSLGRVAALFAPRTAYLLWVVALEVALGVLLLTFWRRCEAGWLRPFAAAALLLSSPYLLELHMGQFTFMATACVAMMLLLTESGGRAAESRPRGRVIGGLIYAAGTLLKVFPMVALPALARVRRYAPAAVLGLLLPVVVSAPYFAVHPEQWRVFFGANFTSPHGGMDAGNFGLVYLLHLLTSGLGRAWQEAHWNSFVLWWRVALLGGASMIVLLGRGRDVVAGTVAMLLAHFLSYVHVWEHHASGILLLGLLLLWALQRKGRVARAGDRIARIGAVASVIVLALPTPSALFDVAKDPAVWNPSVSWPQGARYAVVLCKALPTAVLFAIAMSEVLRDGVGLPWRMGSRASGRA